MIKQIPWHAYVVVAVVCASGFAAVYVITHRTPEPPAFSYGQAGDFDVQQAHWEKRIRAIGAVAAYREFSQWTSAHVLVAQHTLAHAFGAALYAIEGGQGLSVCDAQFAYGCFHVVLGKAISDLGLSEVNKLDEICRQSLTVDPEGCEHGVGHGIVAYIGYTRDALAQALAVCDSLPQDDATPGCLSGVFMEYNVRTMLGELATTRTVAEGNLFAPCDTLLPMHQKTCVFWQPQWWMHGVYGDRAPDERLYRTLGELCDKTGDADLVRSCYQGLGNITPEDFGYSPGVSAMMCKASSESKLHQLFCISFAANVIGDYRTREEGRQTCTGFTGEALTYCTEYADGRANLFHPDAVPPLESL